MTRSRFGKSQQTRYYRLKREECYLYFRERFRLDLCSVSRFGARADETAADVAPAVVLAVGTQNPEH
jgi:hypothetical protein